MSLPQWTATNNGFRIEFGGGALVAQTFYDNGWWVSLNDQVLKHSYPNEKSARKDAMLFVFTQIQEMQAQFKEVAR